jgi:hypothetical protein
MLAFRPSRRSTGALALALAGFVVTFGESSTTTVNGVVTESHEYNCVAAIGLAATVVRSLLSNGQQQVEGPRPLHFAFLGLVVTLAVYQILHGLDLV